ncbi:protein sarah isoform X2 [Neocloeon triangulifer]|uniref:protein sarah isoform X2 n=1 Tax=Neocloeon triangulifer TaxID=2078957 RepID=UPI00286F4FC4|nr:protein sarah isoform X2 [Neocloeon triangulifer]
MAGEESASAMEADIIINAADGLPNAHPNFEQHDQEDVLGVDNVIHDDELPNSLIVTNLNSQVFKSDEEKHIIESLFNQYGETVSFQYFRSFCRMRVNFKSPASAARARIELHQAKVGCSTINCYFAQPVSPIDLEDQHLQPPALTKQFLISPPASPPYGWEQKGESDPLVNYDLLAAIANLSPGETHELHPPSGGQPGIVVHICEETAAAAESGAPRQQIQHTRCPDT